MMLKHVIRIIALTALAACGSEKNTEISIQSVLQGLGKVGLSKVIRTKEKTEEQTLNRQIINDSKKKLYLGQIDRLGIVNLFTETTRNGSYSTFRSPANISVTVDNGIIIATRGLGLDLISQRSDLSANKMFSTHLKQKPYTRFYRYLRTDNTLVSHHFICINSYTGIERIEVVGQSYNTRKFVETCQSEVSNFNNKYWVSTGSVKIMMSSQMTHPELGHITLQSLN